MLSFEELGIKKERKYLSKILNDTSIQFKERRYTFSDKYREIPFPDKYSGEDESQYTFLYNRIIRKSNDNDDAPQDGFETPF